MSQKNAIARAILARCPALTDREADIVARVAQGWSNAAIAFDLSVTERTVKNTLTAVPHKVGIPTGGSVRVRLALWAHGVTVDTSPLAEEVSAGE